LGTHTQAGCTRTVCCCTRSFQPQHCRPSGKRSEEVGHTPLEAEMFGVQAPWSESLHVVLFSVPSAKLTVLSSLGFCTFHIFACASQYMATWWAPCTRGSCLPWGSQVKLGRGCRCLNRTQGKSLATSSSCLSMCLFFMFLTMLSVGPELFLLCPFAKHEIAVLAIARFITRF
jgi:hypothetical protein